MDSPPRYYRCFFICPCTFSRLASHPYTLAIPSPRGHSPSAPLRSSELCCHHCSSRPRQLSPPPRTPYHILSRAGNTKIVSPRRRKHGRPTVLAYRSKAVNFPRSSIGCRPLQYGPAPNRALLGLQLSSRRPERESRVLRIMSSSHAYACVTLEASSFRT